MLAISVGLASLASHGVAQGLAGAAGSPAPAAPAVPPDQPGPQSADLPAASGLDRSAKATSGSPSRPLRYAFFANWDDQSLKVLREEADAIDVLVPVWVHLASAKGDIELNDPELQRQVASFVEARPNGPKITPLINNYVGDHWDPAMAAALLSSPAARANLISNLAFYVRERRFSGINVDFESLPDTAETDFQAFVAELDRALAADGGTVSVTLPLADAWSAAGFAAHCQAIILMSYDEHAASTEPGPIASDAWFKDAIRERYSEVDPSKLVIAIGSYGYDWEVGGGSAELLTFEDAVHSARMNKVAPVLDPESRNPNFVYRSADNKTHHVWYLDAVTAFNQIAVSRPSSPRGFALWRIGAEDPSIWTLFRQLAETSELKAESVREINLGDRLGYWGTGEIIRIDSGPKPGMRLISTDPATGEIATASFSEPPSGYDISRLGHRDGKIVALTFDDGPDPAATPEILDILDRFGVQATFFVLGDQVAQHPEILAEIAQRGHDIGNHTWSHPNLAQLETPEIRLELERTERLIVDVTRRPTTLFRPPYAEGLEPRSANDLAPLLIADELGLYAVGMNIDPQDWTEPGADEIVRRVLEGARAGAGNIVSLHDSGGDRSQTISALPQIIGTLQKEGFRFVRVSELLEAASP